MAEETKTQKVHFSLPYRPGMETEPGYVSQVSMVSKTWPNEKTFAKFAFDLDETIAVDDAKALESGRKTLRQNAQRMAQMGKYADKYGVTALGVSGGLTKTDIKQLKRYIDVLPVGLDEPYMVKKTGAKFAAGWQAIQAVFKKHHNKDVTEEEIKAAA